MLPDIPWRKILHHGEIVGFLAAWAVAIVIALAGQANTEDPQADPDGLASAAPMGPEPAVVK